MVQKILEPEKQKSRKPLILISKIDKSGSIEKSTIKGLKGKEDVGISRLGLNFEKLNDQSLNNIWF